MSKQDRICIRIGELIPVPCIALVIAWFIFM